MAKKGVLPAQRGRIEKRRFPLACTVNLSQVNGEATLAVKIFWMLDTMEKHSFERSSSKMLRRPYLNIAVQYFMADKEGGRICRM